MSVSADRLPVIVASASDELVDDGAIVRVDPIRNPYRAYLDNLRSPGSKTAMRGCLDRLARIIRGAPLDDQEVTGEDFPWHVLRYEHTTRLRAKLLQQGWSAAYINKHLVALRRVLKESWRLGLVSLEESQRAGDLEPERTSVQPAGQHLPPEVVAALLDACDAPDKPGDPAGVRDKAMLATLYRAGLRRDELVRLTLADWDPTEHELRVLGKGNKERDTYVPADVADLIAAWISVRGRTPGALFPSVWKGGRLRTDHTGRPAHMTGQALRKMLIKRIAQAAHNEPTIAGKKIAPHDFRRTFIGDLLDEGVDLATAQALAGHASPTTTARYDRRPKATRRAAVQRLRLPGQAQPGADSNGNPSL
ncbi:tyrosine-type recombinase/integrase [Nonomuraea sp. NPDC050202]|uniref:tyrosine-type recombinase/integrase n=1 Tax=Nonomuraea sp. NPDC050202 TaxID=3155035 RepID=UPI0033D17084